MSEQRTTVVVILRDLIAIDETETVARLDGDAVKEIQLGNLQDVVHVAELGSVGGDDRRSDGQRQIRDRASVFHERPPFVGPDWSETR